ncbi:MAG: hypothetical protein HUJ75_02525, partial [Parasporobacterium sp.]|nr:hypothetical protein [Parasporobacterium sp.]
SGDHYPYGVDNLENLYGYEINTCLDQDHNVGIIWSGCLEHDLKNMACEISAPTYSLDLLPTLSNLFGVEYDSRLLVGRDIFSSTEALVVWNSFSWKSEQGWYNSGLDEFYPSDGCTLSGDELEAYIQRINNSVANKISFSDQVIEKDYYGLLFGADPDAGSYDPGWGNDGELSN